MLKPLPSSGVAATTRPTRTRSSRGSTASLRSSREPPSKGRRRERLSARLHTLAPEHPETESIALDRLEVRTVVDALQQLSAADREVLLLAAWEGLSHGEIAAALGCSENAAAIRLHRARKRLTETCRKKDMKTRHTGEEGSSDHCGHDEGTR